MKRFKRLIFKSSLLILLFQFFKTLWNKKSLSLELIYKTYSNKSDKETYAVDLGCGKLPSNKFKASNVCGLDLIENKINNVSKCRLGFERLPFEDNSMDYITAYDLLEHIPRYSELSKNGPPFIYIMNECYRVLKEDGIFFSKTPIFPFWGAFQDPTHNNIMSRNTFHAYFSDQKLEIAKHYGIKSNFKILHQQVSGQHLIAVLSK